MTSGPRRWRSAWSIIVGPRLSACPCASLSALEGVTTRIDGQWTIWGLARALPVDRDRLYARIKDGTLPATRHPVIGHYLIPNDPVVFAQLKTSDRQAAKCRRVSS